MRALEVSAEAHGSTASYGQPLSEVRYETPHHVTPYAEYIGIVLELCSHWDTAPRHVEGQPQPIGSGRAQVWVSQRRRRCDQAAARLGNRRGGRSS